MKGGCLCGRTRYACEGEPLFTAVCHCRNCQKQTGTAYSVILGILSESLETTGHIMLFADIGDTGGIVRRHFCPACGSPLYSETDSSPGLSFIKAGTLDDTSGVRPIFQIYCNSALDWAKLTGVEAFEQMRPVRSISEG